jgi:DNA-directed RNA polymerase-3 subunit RPC5
LDVLQNHGLLLRDLWVPKTALLYSKKEASFRKKDDENMRTARNYILNSFRKNPVISYSELNLYPPLKPHFDETLKVLAVNRPSTRDWKFKEQPDVSFAELYPEIAESQEQIWERMDKQLVEALKPHRDIKNASMTSKTGKSPHSDKGPSKSASEVHSGGGRTMSDETRAALSVAIKEVLQVHKVCT